MSQPNFDEQSSRDSSRFNKLAFVVGEPAARAATDESDRAADTSFAGSDRECAQWLNDRLTACYND